MPGRRLQVVSVGNPPAGSLREIAEPLLSVLGVTASGGKAQLPTPAYAFNKERNQYHCNAILKRLVQVLEPGQDFALGITDVDLFMPDAPFVFGDADRDARVGIVSVARLGGGLPGGLKRRLQAETLHQVAHLLGLSFCEDGRCILYVAQSPAEVDRKNLALCNLCRNEYAKLKR